MQRPAPDAEVFDSWKEISRYLNRDVRTLQRWEHTRGLPVRRLPGGAKPGVYAVRSELDAWKRSSAIHVASAEDGGVIAPSVAVLPFVNLSVQQEDEYFADGLADEIITGLSRVPGLRVTARTSSFALRGKQQDIRDVGRRLNARAVLEGSVRRAGSRVRITAQLVETAEGYHLWSERFDRELTDVFAIQDEITQRVVDALRVRLTEPARPVKPQTQDQRAYYLWLKARYHTLRRSPTEIQRSRELFEEAITLDPLFARAHLGLAESLWEAALFGLERPRDAVAIGRPAIARALEIDDTLGEAHAMLGVYLGVHDFEWGAAEVAFRRAIEISPSSADVRSRYASYLLAPYGRLDDAMRELEAALQFDPLSAVLRGQLGHVLIFRREFDRAADELRFVLELDPEYWWAHIMLAGAYAFQGRFHESLAVAERLVGVIGAHPILLGAGVLLHSALGNRAAAEEARRLLMEKHDQVQHVPLAWAHMGLSEVEQAIDELELAVEEREPLICELQPKPLYDGLREHPRFRALLARMRVPARIGR